MLEKLGPIRLLYIVLGVLLLVGLLPLAFAGYLLWRKAGWAAAALVPVASVYGLVIGSLLSGSFAVEMVTAWPGLGRLMLDALRARDVYLVAGCAAAGSLFLALGTLVSDAAVALVNPRARE